MLAMISATVLIVVLLLILIQALRRWERRSEHEKKLSQMGNKIVKIERLIASQQQDDEVCRELVELALWCNKNAAEGQHIPANTLDTIRAHVGAFIIRTELIMRVPVPEGLPKALCLCRYLVPSIETHAQSDDEFEKALLESGLSVEQVQNIQRRGKHTENGDDRQSFLEWILRGDFSLPNEQVQVQLGLPQGQEEEKQRKK